MFFQAKKFKGETMMLALDLIEFDPVYTKVFELVFGGVSSSSCVLYAQRVEGY